MLILYKNKTDSLLHLTFIIFHLENIVFDSKISHDSIQFRVLLSSRHRTLVFVLERSALPASFVWRACDV